jgi:hypothetical protein
VVTVQVFGDRQSALLAQVVLQAPPPQTYGLHDDETTFRQVPLPLQVRAGVSVELLQLPGTHTVPLA